VVTHSTEVAERAERILRLRDGRVAEDRSAKAVKSAVSFSGRA
jgi:hypothetical protein